jgi:hypothetical protein
LRSGAVTKQTVARACDIRIVHEHFRDFARKQVSRTQAPSRPPVFVEKVQESAVLQRADRSGGVVAYAIGTVMCRGRLHGAPPVIVAGGGVAQAALCVKEQEAELLVHKFAQLGAGIANVSSEAALMMSSEAALMMMRLPLRGVRHRHEVEFAALPRSRQRKRRGAGRLQSGRESGARGVRLFRHDENRRKLPP